MFVETPRADVDFVVLSALRGLQAIVAGGLVLIADQGSPEANRAFAESRASSARAAI